MIVLEKEQGNTMKNGNSNENTLPKRSQRIRNSENDEKPTLLDEKL